MAQRLGVKASKEIVRSALKALFVRGAKKLHTALGQVLPKDEDRERSEKGSRSKFVIGMSGMAGNVTAFATVWTYDI